MSLPQRILMATDFSECADRAAERAIELAALAGATIEWTHAVEISLEAAPLFDGSTAPSPIDRARKLSSMKLVGWEREAAGKGVRGSSQPVEGNPAKSVTARAAEIQADLIVLGSHGYTGVRHALIGSVAERIVRESDCSVLVVRNDAPLADGQAIVMGEDLSPSAAKARKLASALARATERPLHVVHALEAGIPYLSTLEVLVPDDLVGQFYEDARTQLDAIAQEDPGVAADATEISSDHPATAICDAARKLGASLIVVGSHGRRGVERFLLGSAAERIIRRAPCSVLVVR